MQESKKRKIALPVYVSHAAMVKAAIALAICLKRLGVGDVNVRRLIVRAVEERHWCPVVHVVQEPCRCGGRHYHVIAPPGMCWRPSIFSHLDRVPYPLRMRVIQETSNQLRLTVGAHEVDRSSAILEEQCYIAGINLVLEDYFLRSLKGIP